MLFCSAEDVERFPNEEPGASPIGGSCGGGRGGESPAAGPAGAHLRLPRSSIDVLPTVLNSLKSASSFIPDTDKALEQGPTVMRTNRVRFNRHQSDVLMVF